MTDLIDVPELTELTEFTTPPYPILELDEDNPPTRICEFYEECSLFAHLCKSRDKVYRIAYCQGDFEVCARRKLRLDGVSAPDDLMPSGYRMQPDGSAYPSMDPDLKCDTRPVEIVLLGYWIVILGFLMASSVLL